MGNPVRLEPLVGVDLVGAQRGSNVIVENFRRRTRKGLLPGITKPPSPAATSESSIGTPSSLPKTT